MKNYPTVIYYICCGCHSSEYHFKKVSGKLVEYGGYYFGVHRDSEFFKVTDISSGLCVGVSPKKIKFPSEEEAISSINDDLISAIEKYGGETIIKLRSLVSKRYSVYVDFSQTF